MKVSAAHRDILRRTVMAEAWAIAMPAVLRYSQAVVEAEAVVEAAARKTVRQYKKL
jgi:hypothetical protein